MIKLRKNEIAYQFNSDYLISLRPNIKNYFKRSDINGSNLILWTTNHDSFRGKEVRQNHQRRIIVYGDSNIQGIFSEEKNTFVVQLEKHLNKKPNKLVDVINSGIVGSGPDQYYLKFFSDVDIYKPDIVIFNIFADNDFGDIIRNRLFCLDDRTEELRLTNFRRKLDSELVIQKPTSITDILSSLLLVRSTKKLINTLFIRKNNKQEQEIIHEYGKETEYEYSIYRNHKPRFFSHFRDHYDIDIACFPNSASSKTKMKLLSKILEKAKRFAELRKIEFCVVIEPSVVDLTDNFIINFKSLEQTFPLYKRTNISETVENICKGNKIKYINLFDIFSKNNPNSLYFKGDDNHWNDLGQQVASKEVADFITQNFSELLKIEGNH